MQYSLDTKITIFSVNRHPPCPLCVCGKVLAFGGAGPSVGFRLPVPVSCVLRACIVRASCVSGSWRAVWCRLCLAVRCLAFRRTCAAVTSARAASALRCASRTPQGRFLYRTVLRWRPVRQKARFCTTRLGPPPQNRLWLIAEARPARVTSADPPRHQTGTPPRSRNPPII